jgi:hypothetical protein
MCIICKSTCINLLILYPSRDCGRGGEATERDVSRGGSDPHNSNFLAKIAKRFFRRSRPILRLRAKKKLPRAACNGNTRLVGSQGSTETYPSTTRTCITRLGYFPAHWHPRVTVLRYPLSRGKSPLTPNYYHPESLLLTDVIPRHKPHQTWEKLFR